MRVADLMPHAKQVLPVDIPELIWPESFLKKASIQVGDLAHVKLCGARPIHTRDQLEWYLGVGAAFHLEVSVGVSVVVVGNVAKPDCHLAAPAGPVGRSPQHSLQNCVGGNVVEQSNIVAVATD